MADDAETAKEAKRDPIAAADARQREGRAATTAEQEEFDDAMFDAAFSPNILERERFESMAPEGAPSADHAAELAQYQQDVARALVDRDPEAFVRARAALGEETTPEDLARFEDPAPSDTIGAARSAQLQGIDIPVDSALAEQTANVLAHIPPGKLAPTNTLGGEDDGPRPTDERHEALGKARDDVVQATVERDVEKFVEARERLGSPASPAEIDAFRNPTPAQSIELARHLTLTGHDIPEGSPLDTEVDDILTGGSTPSGQPTTPGVTGSVGSGQQGSNPSSTSPSPGGGSEPPVDRSDLPIGTGGSGGNAGTGGANPSLPTSAGGGSLPDGAGVPTGGGGSQPSAIDAALANLSGGSGEAPESFTPQGSAPTADGLSYPGSVGAQGGGGNPAPAAAEPPADDFQVEEHPDGSTTSMDDEGNIRHNFPNGSYQDTHPDGSAESYDANGNQTATWPPGTFNYEATKEQAFPGDKPAGEEKPAEEEPEEEDEPEEEEEPEEEDDDEEGLTDPGADPGTSPVGVSVDVLMDPAAVVSSTGGDAVTNTGRGDLPGDGAITGAVHDPDPVEPNVIPDGGDGVEGIDVGGRVTIEIDIAPVDGVNPDLIYGTGGVVGPPEEPDPGDDVGFGGPLDDGFD